MLPALAALLAIVACKTTPDDPSVVDCPPDEVEVDDTDPVERTSAGVMADDDLSGLAGLDCASGTGCADASERLGDTCCAFGDSLVEIGDAYFNEAVDLATDGEHVVFCGGFGPAIASVAPPIAFKDLWEVARCQRIEFGPRLSGGEKVFWVAHHGDDWVPAPGLWTYQLDPVTGVSSLVQHLSDPGILFENLDYQQGRLYVATHATGLRVYDVSEDGSLTLLGSLQGFDNAMHVEVRGQTAYVADDTGIRVVDVSTPAAMSHTTLWTTNGRPRNLSVEGDRVYVALGNDGLDVISRTTGAQLAHADAEGSVQDVAVEDGLVALANWTHVSLLDADSLRLLGTEKVKRQFEQDLGIGLVGNRLFVAEWQGLTVLEYQEGFVAPDLFLEDDLYLFNGDYAATYSIDITNRGPLDLDLSSISTTNEQFVPSEERLVVRSGERRSFELSFSPPGDNLTYQLQLCSNDPDRTTVDVPLIATSDSNRLGVGDRLTDDFAFLDPTGGNSLENLEGHVLVLAYFALF